jgi:hypothetical protein
VVADMALESEASTALAMRLAGAVDRGEHDLLRRCPRCYCTRYRARSNTGPTGPTNPRLLRRPPTK